MSMLGICDYRGVIVSFQRKKQNSPLKPTKLTGVRKT